jgi:hypothetical protein
MSGFIRKIITGRDPKTDGMAYSIGMRVGKGSVCSIVFQENDFDMYGVSRYIVYVQEPDGQVAWKVIENMPCIIEYDLDF